MQNNFYPKTVTNSPAISLAHKDSPILPALT